MVVYNRASGWCGGRAGRALVGVDMAAKKLMGAMEWINWNTQRAQRDEQRGRGLKVGDHQYAVVEIDFDSFGIKVVKVELVKQHDLFDWTVKRMDNGQLIERSAATIVPQPSIFLKYYSNVEVIEIIDASEVK